MHAMADGSHDRHEELRRRYADAPLLTLGGVAQPVAIWPAPTEQRADPDSVVGACEPSVAVDGDREHLARLRERCGAAGRELYDGTIAAMRRLHTEGRLAIDWSPGSYFDQLATCETPVVHDAPGDPLRDGAGRCAGIGVSTVMRIATDDGHVVWLGRLSDRKATGGGAMHVMPSAMLEPEVHDANAVSIVDTVLREFAEELFDEHGTGERWWVDTQPVAELLALIERGDARLELTGVAMNLVNLRPEVCTLLRIDTHEWHARWAERVAMNWEFESAMRAVRFDDERTFADDLGSDLRALVPPAAGALGLALMSPWRPPPLAA